MIVYNKGKYVGDIDINPTVSFKYIGDKPSLPASGNMGEVITVHGEPYVFNGSSWEYVGDISENQQPTQKQLPVTCERCGAPLTHGKCEYCGTDYR